MAARFRFSLLLASLALCGCQTAPPAPPEAVAVKPAGEGWRAIASADDLDRLARLDGAWREGLAEARAAGFAAQLRAEGPLLAPEATLPRAALPPGSYRCRLVRLGAGPGRRALTAYPSYFCHVGVEEALLSFTKQTGSERPGGYLWPDGDARMVFLGALAAGGAAVPPAYGENRASDLIGAVERIGAFRYRLVLPWPQAGAKLDVLELVPVIPAGD